MTPEQWQRAVEVLEKELGLEGQPRAVVKHLKHGREHIHVVWARTDIDDMVLRSDSQNYQAHERASQKLEIEFGHEPVPGKHAKRDREKQPEYPRAEANHAEWQQSERTGLRPAEMREQITALKKASDNAQAFKAALEEHGYVLARGDRRDFVVIDPAGQVHSLGRQIDGMKAAALREFMKAIDPQTLPTVEEAREARKRAPKPEPAPAPEPPKTPEPAADPVEAERETLRKAVTARHEEEKLRLIESHKVEAATLRDALDADTRRRLAALDKSDKAQAEARRKRRELEAPAGIGGLIDSIQAFFSPAKAAEREEEQKRDQEQLAARQKQHRDEYTATLQQKQTLEIENLAERQARQLRDHAAKGEAELERYLREQEAARQIRLEVEERERQREQERTRDGPEQPPPRAR
ncbi:MAG: relaxase/mobilization nuclease domain-containing protein [Acidobacteriota bacterium]